jgi:hypothetical protein
MNDRGTASALLLLLALPLAGCNTIRGLEVIPGPGTQVVTAKGQTAQYHAMATYQMGSASETIEDVTDSAHWASADSAVGTINSLGLATATGAGTTAITATIDGGTAASDFTVNLSSSSTLPATVVPGATLNASTTVGQTTQFIAIGNQAGSAVTQDLTSSVTWISSASGVATINSSGLATGVAAGSTVITAELNGVVSSSTLLVNVPTGASSIPAMLTVIPAVDVAQITIVGETTQFIAIGHEAGTNTVTDLTSSSSLKWISSDTSVATINSAGLATGVAAVGSSSVTAITAELTSTDGSVITATSSISVNTTGGTVNLPTLSVYETGNGSGVISTSDSTISCGNGSPCTGHFSQGTVVTLTAVPATGSTFGGWSSTCTPVLPNTATPPYTAPYQCTVTISPTNISVGAVFNAPVASVAQKAK